MKKPSENAPRLSPVEQRVLLKQLLEAEGEDQERAPLSFGQERLWILDQLRPANSSYRLCRAFRLKGPFSVRVAGGIFDEIVDRHEILRTTFPSLQGNPVQRIGPIHKVDLPVDGLSEIPLADREAALRGRLREELNKPFDLATGPLVRIRLIHLGSEEIVLFIVAHHIVCDGWSMSVVVHELLALYEAFTSGQASPLSPLPFNTANLPVHKNSCSGGGNWRSCRPTGESNWMSCRSSSCPRACLVHRCVPIEEKLIDLPYPRSCMRLSKNTVAGRV